jgi:hypothetical protein
VEDNKKVKPQDVLEQAVIELHWMARRYADKRSSYVTRIFNNITRKLLWIGVELGEQEGYFARDGMGREFDGLTSEEVAAIKDKGDGNSTLDAMARVYTATVKLKKRGLFSENSRDEDVYELLMAIRAVEALRNDSTIIFPQERKRGCGEDPDTRCGDY